MNHTPHPGCCLAVGVFCMTFQVENETAMTYVFGLLLWLGAINESALVVSAESAAHPDGPVLIRPFNYDPADPWEYTRRRGIRSPESLAASTTWNRPPGHRSSTASQARAKVAEPPRVIVIGASRKGVPIKMHLYGNDTRPLLVFGAIHGDEPNTAGVTRRLIEHLDAHPEAYRNCGVAVIPVANPDGLALKRRGNAREVDLNRNFPARNWQPSEKGRYHGGTHHSSEPETLALIKAIELLDPRGIVSLHCIRRGRHGNNFDGPGDDLAKLLASRNGYRVLKTIGYPTPGSFGSWAGVDRAIPTVTLELPSDLDTDAAWRENREALLDAISKPTAHDPE